MTLPETKSTRKTHPLETDVKLSRWSEIIFSIVSLSFVFYLGVLCYEGFFTRFLADDFCYANPAIHLGIFPGFVSIYTGWSGRFSSIFFIQVGSVLGNELPAILPLIWILTLSVSIFWFYNHGLQIREQSNSRVKAALLSFTTIFFFFLMTPNRYQILDWMNGSITYTAPLILLILTITWCLHAIRFENLKMNWFGGFGILFIAFVGAGFSETNTALLITSIFITLLLSIILLKKGEKWRVIRWEILALTGSLLGLLVMVLSPGNAVRKALLPIPPSLSTFIFTSIQFAFDFFSNTVRTLPLPTALVLIIPLLIGFVTARSQDMLSQNRIKFSAFVPFLLIPIIAFILWVSICAPSVYYQSAYPEARALAAAILIYVLGIGLFGFRIGNLVSHSMAQIPNQWHRFLTIIALVLILLGSAYPIRAAILHFPVMQTTIQFGQAWDKRDSIIHQAITQHQLDLIVPVINSQHGLQEVDVSPDNWVNQCVAKYYGLTQY